MKFKDLLGSLAWEKFFMAVFEFIRQFFFQNDVFKLLQNLGSEYSLRTALEVSNSFTVLRQTGVAKKIP
jgi:hypothetical protein